MENAKKLLEFIKESVSPYHAIKNIEDKLINNNYRNLSEAKEWSLSKGEKYYVKRNSSSIIAFSLPTDITDLSFNISASHSDSPTFKIKPNFEIEFSNKYLNLSTEVYGGPILSSWVDRPLSIAGRVIVHEDNKLKTKLVNVDRDLLVIPNMAPHLHPEVNGMKYNPQTDMPPLYSSVENKKSLISLLVEQENIKEEDIMAYDLFVYSRNRGQIIGAANEFLLAPQIDDLACAYTTLEGFLEAENQKSVNVYCCFDNEEIGSRTKQGAGSRFLFDTVNRINSSLGFNQEQLYCHLNRSLMVSADNGHAVHPAMPNKTDSLNNCFLNGGIVIKHNANGSYTTDAISNAIFKKICAKASVPTQDFTNRSDIKGGGTLGAISSLQLSINSIDIGLPQLAMHSSLETTGVKDITSLIKALKAFYESHITVVDNTYMVL